MCGAGITDDQALGSDEDELPVLKRIEADLKSSSDLASPDGKQVDLFSEIHLNELKKLEKQVEQVRQYIPDNTSFSLQVARKVWD